MVNFCFVLNKLNILKIVLDLKANCEDSTDSSHIPYTQFPLLLFYVSMVRWFRLMNQH